MELRILNYFLTVAREENITKAAALLHISQPSLSRQLMQLEEELGVKLFRRSNHSIVLTDEGVLLKRRAKELVLLAEKTKRELSKEEAIGGEISIGSGELQSTRWLSKIMVSFQKEYPRVAYELYSGNSDNIQEQIERGSLDFGLLLEPVDIRKYNFLRVPIKEEWCALVCEDTDLAKKDRIEPKDLKNIPLLFTRRELVQNELKNWFGCYADQIRVVASGNLPYNMAMLARQGAGVFINLRLDCKYEGLRVVPLSPPLESSTVLVWKKAQSFSSTSEVFLKYVKKYIGQISDNPI